MWNNEFWDDASIQKKQWFCENKDKKLHKIHLLGKTQNLVKVRRETVSSNLYWQRIIIDVGFSFVFYELVNKETVFSCAGNRDS